MRHCGNQRDQSGEKLTDQRVKAILARRLEFGLTRFFTRPRSLPAPVFAGNLQACPPIFLMGRWHGVGISVQIRFCFLLSEPSRSRCWSSVVSRIDLHRAYPGRHVSRLAPSPPDAIAAKAVLEIGTVEVPTSPDGDYDERSHQLEQVATYAPVQPSAAPCPIPPRYAANPCASRSASPVRMSLST